MSDHTFFISLLTIEMVIPYAQSLKDKRSEVRGLKDRIRDRFNVSVAEVGYQDKWQRAVLAVSLVGCDKRQLESNADRISNLCTEFSNLEIVSIDQEWL